MLKKRLHRDDFEFIGVKSFDPKDREYILDKYDEYQIKKLEFLNLYYPNHNTRLTYYNNYQNNFHDYEVQKGKDLMNFSTDEMISVIKSCVWTLEGNKDALMTFAKVYCSWCKSVLHEIPTNPCDLIVKSVVATSSKVLLKQKILPLNIMYKQFVQMEQEKLNPSNMVVVLLARYGISGDNLEIMRNLKWQNIDRQNLFINLENENGVITTRVPIDENFLFWLDKVPHTIDDTYVVYKKGAGSAKPLAYASVYTRFRLAFQSIEAKQFGFKDLLFSRQVELLLQMRRRRQLNSDDFRTMIEKFNGTTDYSYTRVNSLMKKYESLTGDMVLNFTPTGKAIINPEHISKEESKKVVEDILKGIDFDISNTDNLDIEAIFNEGILTSKEKANNDDNEISATKEEIAISKLEK